MGKEKGGKGSKDNVGGDNARSELHKKSSRETSDSGEEFGSDSSKVSNCDNLNVSQSNCHVEGSKQIAKMGVAKGN
eukprot:5458642-Ditylum_brightwellii.AAC.1